MKGSHDWYKQLSKFHPNTFRPISDDGTKTLVQAFISCRLDYCNALLSGISDGLINRLQSVQNEAAWLVTGASWRDHITPIGVVAQSTLGEKAFLHKKICMKN